MLSLDGGGNALRNRIRRLEQHSHARESDVRVLAGVADRVGISVDAHEAEPCDQAPEDLRVESGVPARITRAILPAPGCCYCLKSPRSGGDRGRSPSAAYLS